MARTSCSGCGEQAGGQPTRSAPARKPQMPIHAQGRHDPRSFGTQRRQRGAVAVAGASDGSEPPGVAVRAAADARRRRASVEARTCARRWTRTRTPRRRNRIAARARKRWPSNARSTHAAGGKQWREGGRRRGSRAALTRAALRRAPGDSTGATVSAAPKTTRDRAPPRIGRIALPRAVLGVHGQLHLLGGPRDDARGNLNCVPPAPRSLRARAAAAAQ